MADEYKDPRGDEISRQQVDIDLRKNFAYGTPRALRDTVREYIRLEEKIVSLQKLRTDIQRKTVIKRMMEGYDIDFMISCARKGFPLEWEEGHREKILEQIWTFPVEVDEFPQVSRLRSFFGAIVNMFRRTP